MSCGGRWGAGWRFVGVCLVNLLNVARLQFQLTAQKLLNVEGVFLVGVRRELVVGVAGQIVLAGKEGPNAPQLQNTFAAGQHGQLVRGHQLFATLSSGKFKSWQKIILSHELIS